MAERDPPGPTSEVCVEEKDAFFAKHDAQLAAAGYAVPAPPLRAPPPPVPPPPVSPPALDFEAWAELSVFSMAASPADVVAALSARGLTPAQWERLDDAYRRACSDDLRAGRQERIAFYESRYKAAQGRGTGEPAPPSLPARAPDALRSTAGLPDLPATLLA